MDTRSSEHSAAWQAERKRIQDEANRKRAEAAKAQHEVSNPRAGEVLVPPQVVERPKTESRENYGVTAKAAASHTNRGAVERGDKLASERPDLAEKVRMGEVKPAEAYRCVARPLCRHPLRRYSGRRPGKGYGKNNKDILILLIFGVVGIWGAAAYDRCRHARGARQWGR